MNRIVGYIMDVDMRLSHEGLRDVAYKHKPRIDLDALNGGEFVLFLNAPFTACKIFGSGNTFVYHRPRNGNPLNPKALMSAVACFDGVKWDYKAALAKEIEASLTPELKDWLKKYRAETSKLKGVMKVDTTTAHKDKRARA